MINQTISIDSSARNCCSLQLVSSFVRCRAESVNVLGHRPTMSRSPVAMKRDNRCRTKVRTGCTTCRIRKVKCDENKPFCHRCVDTGRACDGYRSPFRNFSSQTNTLAHAGGIELGVNLRTIRPIIVEIPQQDIDVLNHYFSTKTMFNVKLSCDEEAREVLQASVTDVHIRNAVSSLKALREDLETSEDGIASVARQTARYKYGLQQYSISLAGLASSLTSPGSNGLKSALLCCQVFISIEQLQGNFAAMVQHIIRGLRIMREYRARPHLVERSKLVPAHHDQLPLLDVFVIKLFAAPCKFAEFCTTTDLSGRMMSSVYISFHQKAAGSHDFRMLAPDMRTELTKIAASTLEFLGNVSQVKSVGSALRLLSVKAALLESLKSWLINLELVQKEASPPGPEMLSVSFMRLFHLILKVVLLGALNPLPCHHTELQTEDERLQRVANNVSERIKAYGPCKGIKRCPRK